MIIFMDLMFCYDQYFAHDIGKLWLAVYPNTPADVLIYMYLYIFLETFKCYFEFGDLMALDLTSFTRFHLRTKNNLTLYPRPTILDTLRSCICSIFYITLNFWIVSSPILQLHAINTEKEMTIQELYCLYCPQQVLYQIYFCNVLPRLFSLRFGNVLNFADIPQRIKKCKTLQLSPLLIQFCDLLFTLCTLCMDISYQ